MATTGSGKSWPIDFEMKDISAIQQKGQSVTETVLTTISFGKQRALRWKPGWNDMMTTKQGGAIAMIKFSATEDQVRLMAARAVNASRPMGMGFLHYDPEKKYLAIEFQLDSRGEMHLDYVGGRMVKLDIWPSGDDMWRTRETDSEYQSWSAKMSMEELIASAGGTIIA